MILIDDAISACVTSFCLSRTATYPFGIQRTGHLIVTADNPPRKTGGRNPEIFVMPGATASNAISQIKDLQLGERYVLSVMCDMKTDIKELSSDYKSLGFRLRTTEALMVLDLSKPIQTQNRHEIKPVETPDDAEKLKILTKARVLASEVMTINGGEVRTFYCDVNDEAVAWCRSIITHPTAAYVSGMFTKPEFRRQGIGTELLAAMTKSDADHGLQYSVLLATHTGEHLYKSFGYERIGTLVMFSPRR